MKLKLPDSVVTIIYIIILCGVASYILPSGHFSRNFDNVNGIVYVIPDSYHIIDRTPVHIYDILRSIPEGMANAADIIMFVIISGGSFAIIQSTGVISALTGTITKRFYKKESFIIPVIMIFFSFGGAVLGTAEEIIPIVPIFTALALSLGFDTVTGIGMILLGSLSGYVSGFLNPFSTGIAQKIVDLPLFSGLEYRMFCYIILIIPSIIFVCLHANKVKKSNSILEDNDNISFDFSIETLPELSKRHIAIIFILICGIVFLIYGVTVFNFTMIDISTMFLAMGVASGIIARFKSNRIVVEFINGASNILYGALIIGLARGIMIVMNKGNITDTVIFYLSHIVSTFSPILCSISMFFTHVLASLLITSSSGEASTTMPIMVALSDLSKVTRQTAVLAYQFGDGFTNIISPASGYLMAVLAVSGVSWKRWIKWVWPLFAIWSIIGCILIIISVILNYGPF